MSNSNPNNYDIAVVGDWHLAFVTASVLAHCGHKVALVNPLLHSLNPSAKPWTEFPKIPVMEPGLSEMIYSAQSAGNLHFENSISSNWSAKFVWCAVDTPVNERDEPNIEPLIEIFALVKKTQNQIRALITNSQVPIGFCQDAENKFNFPVAYIPENLRLGKGIETFFQADRTVIGCNHPQLAEEIKKLMSQFKTEFLLCNLVTAEMIKHANNIFLATSISFANEMARIGEYFGVDSQLVGKALKLDKRIGSAAYVAPGLGFAGGTLPRDLRVLQSYGQKYQIPTPLIDAVLTVNENTTKSISEIVMRRIEKMGQSKNVLILGYTYKADTDTLRRSLSIDIAVELKTKGFTCWGYDPIMNNQDLKPLEGLIQHKNDLINLTHMPSVILLMTSRPQFKEIKWQALQKQWQLKNSQCLVLDTQGFLNPDAILESGFDFQKLWSPQIKGSDV